MLVRLHVHITLIGSLTKSIFYQRLSTLVRLQCQGDSRWSGSERQLASHRSNHWSAILSPPRRRLERCAKAAQQQHHPSAPSLGRFFARTCRCGVLSVGTWTVLMCLCWSVIGPFSEQWGRRETALGFYFLDNVGRCSGRSRAHLSWRHEAWCRSEKVPETSEHQEQGWVSPESGGMDQEEARVVLLTLGIDWFWLFYVIIRDRQTKYP